MMKNISRKRNYGAGLLIGLMLASSAIAQSVDTGSSPAVKAPATTKPAPKVKIIGTPGSAAKIKATQKPPARPPLAIKLDKNGKPTEIPMVAPPADNDSASKARSGRDSADRATKSPTKKSAKKPEKR